MDATRRKRSLEESTDDELFAILRENGGSEDRDGDWSAFEILFGRYRSKVYGWCLRILGTEEQAADLTQDVFLALVENPALYAAQERFGAWLYVVARNRCLNSIRGGKGARHAEIDDELAATLVAASDPHAEAEQRDLARKIRDVCNRELDEREQEIIHLRYTWGMKVKEITEVLRLENASGARTYLRNAQRKLRRSLEPLRAAPRDRRARGH